MQVVTTRPRHAVPIGTGALHQALEQSRDRSKLDAFCSAVQCTASEVSADGTHLDILRVLDLMRQRGYQASAPAKATHQPCPGQTKWLIALTLPHNGPSLRLGIFTPDAL